MEVSVVSKAMKISLALHKGESVTEYKRAFAFANLFMPQFLECMDAGMSRSEIVTYLMMATGVKRSVATDTICQKLKKIGYVAKVTEDEDDEDITVEAPVKPKVKKEVSETGLVKQKAKPSPVVAPVAPAPIAQVPRPAPVPVPAPKKPELSANIAASTESIQQPKPFSVGIKIGTGFHGVDDVGPQADREREERRMALKSLEAMEKRLGTSAEIIKQQESKDA